MFKFIKNLLKDKFGKEVETKHAHLSCSLENNISLLKDIFSNDDTVIFRKFKLETEIDEELNFIQCCLVFIEGMVDKDTIKEGVINKIMLNTIPENKINDGEEMLNYLVEKVIAVEKAEIIDDLDEIIVNTLYGDTLLLIEGIEKGILISSPGWEKRGIQEPKAEKVVRGPREGFTESININMSLIRRRIRDAKLSFKYKTLGRRTKTKVVIAYIADLASKDILKEVNKRLDEIKIDSILETGYISELVRDSPLTPIKTIGFTERPDIAAAKLLEGRIVILCDGTPFVLTIPYLFVENFQHSEDYYRNYYISSFNRMLKYLALFLSTSTPAIYLAFVTYHQELIPTPLLLSISASRQGVPFPTVLELLLLSIMFEIIREGGVRLPTPIGQTISIVGAIILGDAAVNANLVSAPLIVIIAIAGITSFLIPKAMGLVIYSRFLLIILAAIFGLFGYMFGIIGIFIQLFAMRSFGVPYMLNWGSLKPQDIKDTVIRAPWWYMNFRPKLLNKYDLKRQED